MSAKTQINAFTLIYFKLIDLFLLAGVLTLLTHIFIHTTSLTAEHSSSMLTGEAVTR